MKGRAATWMRAWEARLELLSEPLREVLLPWLARLEHGLGPLPDRALGERGVPDGYEGLTRRASSYERLLMTEWLFATEMPEEFERRAALGEHLFHQIAREAPRGELRTVVWLDASPEQLGAPRLGQLGALLVLARRAERRGASLVWSVLGSTQAFLSGLSPESLETWLRARSLRPPDEAILDEALRERRGLAAQTPELLEECWVLGGPTLVGWARERGLDTICVEEAFEPGRDALELTIARAHARPRSLTLPLPGAADQVAVLTQPLRPRGQPRVATRSASIALSPNGRKLLVRREGAYAALGVPEHPWDTAGALHTPQFQLDPPERVLLAGWKGRNFFFLGLDAHQALGMYYGRELGDAGPLHPRQLPRAWARHALGLLEEAQPPWAVIGRGPPSCGNVLAFRTQRGRLWAHALSGAIEQDLPSHVEALALCGRSIWTVSREPWLSGRDAPEFEVFRETWEQFLALAQAQEEAWLSNGWQGVRVEWLGVRSFVFPSLETKGLEVFLGWRGPRRARPFLAGRFSEELWWLLDEENYVRTLLRQPAHTTVHGVFERGVAMELSLLLLEDDKETISLAGPSHAEEVMRAPGRIVSLIAQPEHRQFAYLTEQGDVGVYSLEHRQHLVRRDATLARRPG